MTNAEKFEEVFGIKLDENPPICTVADHQICVDASDCRHCPLFKFWDKQYRKKKAKKACDNCGWCTNKDITNRPCRSCYEYDQWIPESENKEETVCSN